MMELPLLPDARLVEAVHAIESTHRRIAIVTDSDRCVLGTLTDGDIRRCLLGGGTLETPVSTAMNRNPIVCEADAFEEQILKLMRNGNIEALPIVDSNNRLLRIVHISDLSAYDEVKSEFSGIEFAVIMAGGEGVRLRPLTERIPKPMVDIGGIPLIEHQVLRLARAGVCKIYISVNYLSHLIEEHFKDGSRFGVEIKYLRENSKLGTAGSLSLLPEMPSAPIVVMNGDILTTCNFSGLFDFHEKHGAYITVAAVDYHVNIPFGVIKANGVAVSGLVEKPSERFLCNAGIYALDPRALELIPPNTVCNMTDLIVSCLEKGRAVSVFPIHEYWSDVGTHDDLEKVRNFVKSKTLSP